MLLNAIFQEKKKRKKAAEELAKALGEEAPPKPVPHTTESLRAPDVTFVEADEEDVSYELDDLLVN